MKIWKLALREVGRRKMRTLYTASGVALAVALLVGSIMVGAAGAKDLNNQIARYGHSLTILPATTHETSLRGFGIGTGHYIPEDLVPQIREVYDEAIISGWRARGDLIMMEGMIGGMEAVDPPTFAPRIYAEATVAGMDVVVAGLSPREEYIARYWWDVDEGRLVRSDDQVMLGRMFANHTGLGHGDTVEIQGETFEVAGVLMDTDTPDDYMVFGTLSRMQSLFNQEGKISMIQVRAMCDYCPVGEAQLALNENMHGIRATSQRDVAEAQSAIFSNVVRTMMCFVGLSFGIAVMAVVNMMMGSLQSRLRELGLLKVLGSSHFQMVRLFVYEAVLIGLVGGILGYALGIAIANLIAPMIIQGGAVGIQMVPQWEHLGIAIVAAMVTSMLATLYPALRASGIRPIVAFKAM